MTRPDNWLNRSDFASAGNSRQEQIPVTVRAKSKSTEKFDIGCVVGREEREDQLVEKILINFQR